MGKQQEVTVIEALPEVGDVFITDEAGNPAGGHSNRIGVSIDWQNGSINAENSRNGAFVDEVIAIAIARLEYYQNSKFNCEENHLAIYHLNLALGFLNDRTARRTSAGTEGSHEV